MPSPKTMALNESQADLKARHLHAVQNGDRCYICKTKLNLS